MALALVQTSPKVAVSSAASVALTFASPPTVGNGIIVLVNAWRSAGTTLGTVTDNRGHTYTLAHTLSQSSVATAIYFLPAVATTGAPFTVTVPCTVASQYWVGCAVEVSGVGTGLSLKEIAGTVAASGGTTVTTGSTGALPVDEVLLAAIFAIPQAQGSITVGALSPAWVQAFEELPFNQVAGEADTRLLPSGALGTTVSATWTITATNQRAAVLAAFAAGDGSPPPARLSQLVVETLSAPQNPTARVGQLVVETLSGPILAVSEGRVSQLVVETLSGAPPPEGRVSQLVVESLHQVLPPPVRVTQAPLEITTFWTVPGRVSHAPLEVLVEWPSTLRMSQAALEVAYPFDGTCYYPPACTADFPILPYCPGGDYPLMPADGLDVFPVLPLEECMDASTFVVNMALGEIGITKTIAVLNTDQSQEAHLARLVYTDVLDTVLRDYPWKFATEYAALVWDGGTLAAPVNPDWTYAYLTPLDCVRVRRVCDPDLQRRYTVTPVPFDQRANADGTRDLLLCNEPGGGVLPPLAPGVPVTVTIEYTKRLGCAAQVNDAQFREALVFKLAARLAKGLARDSADADRCLRNYSLALPKAQTQHANQSEPQRPITAPPDWQTGR